MVIRFKKLEVEEKKGLGTLKVPKKDYKERQLEAHRRWYKRNRKSQKIRRRNNYLKEKAFLNDLTNKIIEDGQYNCAYCGEMDIKVLKIVYKSFANVKNGVDNAYEVMCNNCIKSYVWGDYGQTKRN